MITDQGILYIEPSAQTSNKPVIDDLTRKMAGAFRQSTTNAMLAWRGFHTCHCGVNSSSRGYILPGGEQTNSLCVHYMAYHRDEIPPEQIAKVEALDVELVEPTGDELKAPPSR